MVTSNTRSVTVRILLTFAVVPVTEKSAAASGLMASLKVTRKINASATVSFPNTPTIPPGERRVIESSTGGVVSMINSSAVASTPTLPATSVDETATS